MDYPLGVHKRAGTNVSRRIKRSILIQHDKISSCIVIIEWDLEENMKVAGRLFDLAAFELSLLQQLEGLHSISRQCDEPKW